LAHHRVGHAHWGEKAASLTTTVQYVLTYWRAKVVTSQNIAIFGH
jgi:hypothetical protein